MQKINNQGLPSIILSLVRPACFIGPSIMVVSDITTIALNQNVNPIEHTISYFASGYYGWLEKIGIVAVGITILLIGLNCLRARDQERLPLFRIEGVLFIIAAFGFFMTSIFNNNTIGNTSSMHGWIHESSLLVGATVFYLSCLIVMRFMINMPALKYYVIYSGLMCLIGLIILAWMGVSYHLYHLNRYLGLTERILSFSNLLWLSLVGPQVVKLARSGKFI